MVENVLFLVVGLLGGAYLGTTLSGRSLRHELDKYRDVTNETLREYFNAARELAAMKAIRDTGEIAGVPAALLKRLRESRMPAEDQNAPTSPPSPDAIPWKTVDSLMGMPS